MTGDRDRDAEAARRALATVARRLAARDRLAPAEGHGLLDAITATAAAALDAQAASIALHDPERDRLVFIAASGPAAGDVVGLEIPSSAGIAGYAFQSGQPLAVADAAADPRFDRSVADATGYLPGTLLATPLLDDGGTVGVLEVLDRRGGSFTLRDLDLAAAFAREATIAVRARRSSRDAAALLRSALIGAAGPSTADGSAGPALDDAAIEALVSAATAELQDDPDDPTWALADRIARLRTVDPAMVALAIDWLDALLRQREAAERRPGRPR